MASDGKDSFPDIHDAHTPDWCEVRLVVPPGSETDKLIVGLLEREYGFKVVDWCIWEREDGARLEIDPVPAPPPRGFPSPFESSDREETDEA